MTKPALLLKIKYFAETEAVFRLMKFFRMIFFQSTFRQLTPFFRNLFIDPFETDS